jgi:ribose-phosphate pyrophosphokinase
MIQTILSGSANVPLANTIGAALGVTPGRRVLTRFPDGELHVEIEDTMRGQDVYLVQPTSPPADEHLMELLFLADACRRAGAARLTAVIPYFGYARQDRRSGRRSPVGARLVAELIEAAGFGRVVTMDVHTPAIEGFFSIPVEHLSATPLLAETLRPSIAANTIIVAPDLGAVKLAERYQSLLHTPVAVVSKTRLGGAQVAVRGLIGDVKGRSPLIVDDMITTGATIEAAVASLLAAGCEAPISIAAAHGLFVGPAAERLQALPIRQVTVTNTVAMSSTLPFPVQTADVAPVIAEAIARVHREQSIQDLLLKA